MRLGYTGYDTRYSREERRPMVRRVQRVLKRTKLHRGGDGAAIISTRRKMFLNWPEGYLIKGTLDLILMHVSCIYY